MTEQTDDPVFRIASRGSKACDGRMVPTHDAVHPRQNVLVENFTKVELRQAACNQLVEEAYVGDQAEGNSALLPSCSPPYAGRTPAASRA